MSAAEGPRGSARARIPAVDRLLAHSTLAAAADAHGAALAREAARETLAELRAMLGADGGAEPPSVAVLAARAAEKVETLVRPSLVRVFNLTGTVLHTNLGRAPLAEVAISAMVEAARGAVNLEYDVEGGARGERDDHLEAWLTRLTGAEAAAVVNNNAAAVLLVANSLANRRKVAVSRGELVEIGGAFRIPDVIARAGCRLVEVGTTNRTHARDFEAAAEAGLALIMKVHTSNYVIHGFTASVGEARLAEIAHSHAIPFVVDLGSGTLVDLARYGLPAEPTPRETLARGADLVTFSGDKLLGGPQAGIIVGRRDLVARVKRNPMKRALRLDKVTIAALAATLRLHADPESLPDRLPTLRLLARPLAEIRAAAERLAPALRARLGEAVEVRVVACRSQIGSGSLPAEVLESAAVALTPAGPKRGRGARSKALAAAFRHLAVPVIGRVSEDAFVLDLRCLDDEAAFLAQLDALAYEAAGR